jgi:hypothetical protein
MKPKESAANLKFVFELPSNYLLSHRPYLAKSRPTEQKVKANHRYHGERLPCHQRSLTFMGLWNLRLLRRLTDWLSVPLSLLTLLVKLLRSV